MGLQYPLPPSPFQQTASNFCRDILAPCAEEDDRHSQFQREQFNQIAKLGLSSLLIPKEFGGGEQSHWDHYLVIETLARTSPAMAIVIGVTNLVQGAILQFGNAEQKKEYLPKLAKGEMLGAFSLSEPNAGSDAASLETKAVKNSNGYAITGNKMWCSSGGYADLYLLMARTGDDKSKGISAFLVPKDLPGFKIGKQEKKLGLRASSLAELIFESCQIPQKYLLGLEGQGLQVALSQLDAGRIAIGVVGVGIAKAALDLAGKHHQKSPIALESLADIYGEIQALDSHLYFTATAKDKGEKIKTLAAQLKLLGSDLAMHATNRVSELMGFEGVRPSGTVERLLRDAKALQIVEGTNQIQRLVLAREMEQMWKSTT